MNGTLSVILSSMIVAASVTWVAKLLDWLWFRPRKLEKILRKQGLNGNPYRPFLGDLRDMIKFMKADQSRTIELSDDVLPHIFSYYHQTIDKYGENSFIWFGPYPRLNITDPELIKEILRRPDVFQKPLPETGKILPTKVNRRVKAISKEINSILRGVIDQRHKAMGSEDDLLGLLMESNSRFSHEDGNANLGLSIDEVIEECKLFYLAGSETTPGLLVWTMVMLCQHHEWQTRARDEVMRVFGDSQPTFEGLNNLKTLTMILQEVLRLYSPVPLTPRGPVETVKLGDLTFPVGVHLTLLVGMLHGNPEIWGDDAKEFKPQRFAEGVSNAAKIQSSFIPFSMGPRICVGFNYAMIEAKMAIAMIVKHFSFELSPSYLHAPFAVLTLHPQYGAPIIMRNLE